MFERMLDKEHVPSLEIIHNTIKEDAVKRLEELETDLNECYDLKKELKFPFGKNYGWGYKYAHKNKHLCYVFFEQGAYTIFTQIGDKQVPLMDEKLNSMSDKAKEIWKNRYPCGEHGGWISYRVLADEDLMEALEFIKVKVKPAA